MREKGRRPPRKILRTFPSLENWGDVPPRLKKIGAQEERPDTFSPLIFWFLRIDLNTICLRRNFLIQNEYLL